MRTFVFVTRSLHEQRSRKKKISRTIKKDVLSVEITKNNKVGGEENDILCLCDETCNIKFISKSVKNSMRLEKGRRKRKIACMKKLLHVLCNEVIVPANSLFFGDHTIVPIHT